MSLLAFDVDRYYRQVFGGKPYKIDGQNVTPKSDEIWTNNGVLKTKYLDKEIWLPTTLTDLDKIKKENGDRIFSFDKLLLPYTTIKLSGKQTMIKTSLNQRTGTVKELFNQDDYEIVIKGFVIDENRKWPERDLGYLKGIFESGQSFGIDNALTNIFFIDPVSPLDVVVESIDFPEVTGGRIHVRPFSMSLCTDNVFNLIVD